MDCGDICQLSLITFIKSKMITVRFSRNITALGIRRLRVQEQPGVPPKALSHGVVLVEMFSEVYFSLLFYGRGKQHSCICGHRAADNQVSLLHLSSSSLHDLAKSLTTLAGCLL